MPDEASGERPQALVLGGGFAGIGAAHALKKAEVDVVLVDKHDYHTFQPLLYQLATGLLETTAVGHSLRDLVKEAKHAQRGRKWAKARDAWAAVLKLRPGDDAATKGMQEAKKKAK